MHIDSLLSLVAPYDCLGCGAEGALLCRGCRAAFAAPEPRCYRCQQPSRGSRTCRQCRTGSALTSLQAAVPYDGHAKSLLWKLKFVRARGAAAEIADIIANQLPFGSRLSGRDIVITHAPTATRRVRQRGYDQSALLARALARHWGLTYTPLLIRRGRHKQIGSTRSLRTVQMVRAFHPVRAGRIRGAHIILVDDVVTTGATLEAAALALQQAGARRVDAVVFARA